MSLLTKITFGNAAQISYLAQTFLGVNTQ